MTETRFGYVAILGAPNAGKSTLLNQLVGSKVSIVTPKVQTTRTRISGIAVAGRSQIVFVDTPGIFRPRRRLDKAMVEAAWSGAKESDLRLLLVDSGRGFDGETREIVAGLRTGGRPTALVLNKIDTIERAKLLSLTAEINAAMPFEATFMISALNGDGVADLKAWLAERLPAGPWHYPEDQLADISERLLAAEITREKLFLKLHQELPYNLTVETEQWQEMPDGSARLEQTIYVTRDSHKPIVLGKGGQMLKRIGTEARREMEAIFGRRIHLFLFVKVREQWIDDPERYRAMGLEFPR